MSPGNKHRRGNRGHREIWADYDRDTIVVYQAYGRAIADAAIEAGTFVAPFSFNRMTWIKPSFLWLMVRSAWGKKSAQERILAVRITRAGWDKALSLACLTDPDAKVFADAGRWQKEFSRARVHVQWDPERSIRGEKLQHRSIQIGVGRELIREFTDEWIVGIRDLTRDVHKMRDLIRAGQRDKARRHLPSEKCYPVAAPIAARLGMSG